MNPHLHEWLDLLVRWIHLTVGIAWIGASFYFNWLENNLNRRFGLRDELAGNLWAVHGGGFYYLEKYKVAPDEVPEALHWFKWEAYFTWLSGMCMLFIVYYLRPSTYLLDPRVSSISGPAAVALGIGTLVAGWFVYDTLCRSPLGKLGWQFALVGFLLVSAACWALCQVVSARAAYIHVGALIGTMMVGNVFRVIIPSQKALVTAAKTGSPLDAELGKNALRRSRHNNYLTLPVLFIMLSSHFPSTYGHPQSWAVLSGIILIGVTVRHYFNVRRSSPHSWILLPASILGLAALAVFTAPRSSVGAAAGGAHVPFTTVQRIVAERCVRCHSARPSDEVFVAAPNGVMLDAPEQIRAFADRIKVRAVDLETMPFLNKTGMTAEERAQIGAWVSAGAAGQ